MNFLHATASLPQRSNGRSERRDLLMQLGREGRLAAYRGGEFDFATCCAWAARFPGEVPLLNGEFEFIAATMPEVCE